jgi:predicted transcriptional regulator
VEESLVNKWRGLLLLESSTIQDAIHLLEKTALRIVMVVDPIGNLIGTVSDGDVRRGILRGIELNQSVSQVVEKNALVVPPGIGREMIIQLMSVNKIHQIPIVDDSNKVLGIHLWDEINRSESIENLMVIMAGGRGTRLYPQTQNCPKPMLHIAGKPILEHIIEKAKNEGFCNFAISFFAARRCFFNCSQILYSSCSQSLSAILLSSSIDRKSVV